MEPVRNANIGKLATITILFILAMIFGVGFFNTGNPSWFLSNAEIGEPMRIVVINQGESVAYIADDAEFALLAPAIGESVSVVNNNQLIPIGLSDQTIQDYESQSIIIEVHYARPIKFNTSFRTGDPTSLLIPLTGRHAGNGVFFRGHKGEWWYGGMRMANPEPLFEALDQLGLGEAVRANEISG